MDNREIHSWVEFARSQDNTDQLIADPYKICYQFGVDIAFLNTDNDGYLICSEGCKIIIISSRISNKHRKRFITAHELGHFLMHRETMFCCTNLDDTYANRLNTFDQEHEANEFASELLMPQDTLFEMMPEHEMHFRDISNLANRFDVSMTMCARKMVQASKSGKEILFYYNGEKLLWCIMGGQVENSAYYRDRFNRYTQLTNSFPDIVKWNAFNQRRDDVTVELFAPFAGQKMVLITDYTKMRGK